MRAVLLTLLMMAVVVPTCSSKGRSSTCPDIESTTDSIHSEPPSDIVAFWSQTQDFDGQFAGWCSELRPNTYTTQESADDFYSATGDTIVAVDWWGHERDFPLGEEVPEVDEFIIRFCENDTTGPYHVPGTVIYEESVFDFTAEYIGLTEKYYYSSEIPGGSSRTRGRHTG